MVHSGTGESRMRASAIEFRLRMFINASIIILGFWAPWIEGWGIGRRIPVMEWLPLEMSRTGRISYGIASTAVILVGAAIAAVGALLRIWGTAYLGPATVQHAQMQAGAVVADGPYRYVRNPLYLGIWCMAAALAFLMPPTGALFTMAVLSVFLLRLTLGEEAFLAARLGDPYRAYLRAVPRFLPRVRPPLPSAGARPNWFRAVLAELTPIGVFVAMAFVSWSYNNQLMGQVILISFGLSLVARAFMPDAPASPHSEK
jgi:protein-S-isoprenylcysteine O-methyltransferase Ste14